MEDEPRLNSSSGNAKPLSFAEIADAQCPQYMSIGVPYHEYWHGDYTQLAHYRKANEIKRERANYDAWRQGAYVYDALCFASPILRAFAKQGTKPIPYHDEPYGTQKTADPAITKAEFLAKWKSNKAKWKKWNTQQLKGEGGEVNDD